MFHLVSYWCIRVTQYIILIGLFYKNVRDFDLEGCLHGLSQQFKNGNGGVCSLLSVKCFARWQFYVVDPE